MSSLGRLGGKVQESSLYALLLLLPFSKAAVEILFGFLLLGWLLERIDPVTRFETVWARPTLRPLLIAILVFLAVCAASIAVSDFPAQSVRGLIGKWLEYLMFCVITADIGSRPGVVRRGALVLAGSALCIVIQGVTQELSAPGLLPLPHLREAVHFYQRMTGPYDNPIDLATYLMVAIPVVSMCAVSRRGAVRWLVWGLVMVLLGCLARTEALGAWLGLIFGVVIMMLRHPAIRRYGIMVLVVVVLLGGGFLHRTGHLKDTSSLSDIGTVDRIMMWRAALGMIRDRPILGHGLNTFMSNYLEYWVGGERQPRYAHNCYLQVAAETGLVGLLAFAWLLWLLFARMRHGLRRIRADDQLLLLGLFGGLLAFAAQAGIDTNFYSLRQAALFWTLAGLAVGLSVKGSDPVPASTGGMKGV